MTTTNLGAVAFGPAPREAQFGRLGALSRAAERRARDAMRVLSVPAAMFALTAAYALAFHFRAPYMDHWDIVPLYEAMRAGTLSVGDLFALHGMHWHASGYVVMLGLSGPTGMVHAWEVAASLGLLLVAFRAACVLLVRPFDRLGLAAPRGALYALGAFFVFSLDQAPNLLWGWQVAVFATIAGALTSLEALSRDRATVRSVTVAILGAAVAVYGFGTGWALLPIGFVLIALHNGLQGRRAWLALGAWSALSAGLVLHFVLAAEAMGEGGELAARTRPDGAPYGPAEQVLGHAYYAVRFAMSPIVRFATEMALPLAAITAGVVAWLARSSLRRHGSRLVLAISPLAGLVAFGVGSAVLTAMGRWPAFGSGQAFAGRYISFGNTVWLGVIGFLLLVAVARGREAKAALGLASVLLLLKLGTIANVANGERETAVAVNRAAAEVAAAYPAVPADAMGELMAPHQVLGDRLDVLAGDESSLFATRKATGTTGSSTGD